MDAKDFLFGYLKQHGDAALFSRFEGFFNCLSDKEFDEQLTNELLANVNLKHGLAKYIVDRIVNHEDYYMLHHNNVDVRLQCFVAYYLVKEILNSELDAVKARKLAHWCFAEYQIGHGIYLPGLTFSSSNCIVPVRMSPGADIHLGYRDFIVNLLCFNSKRFLMGCRCDTGAVVSMKYHKGCRPVGVMKGVNGAEWSVFMVDSDLTDDYTAVFSNGLDGDGTVEVCDWINETRQRVLFRANY